MLKRNFQFFALKKGVQNTSTQSSNMIEEHVKTKKELNKYKSIVDKFTFSSERLDMLLKNQWMIFNRTDLGYKPLNKQRTIKNLFINLKKHNKSIKILFILL